MVPDAGQVARMRYRVSCGVRLAALAMTVTAGVFFGLGAWQVYAWWGEAPLSFVWSRAIQGASRGVPFLFGAALFLAARGPLARWLIPFPAAGCPRCGYRLIGSPAQNCPECGLAVSAEFFEPGPHVPRPG